MLINHPNPIVRRMARNQAPVRKAWRYLIALFGINLLFAATFLPDDFWDAMVGVLSFEGFFLAAMMYLIIIGYIRREAVDDSVELLYLTPISPSRVLWGLLIGMLWRLRWWVFVTWFVAWVWVVSVSVNIHLDESSHLEYNTNVGYLEVYSDPPSVGAVLVYMIAGAAFATLLMITLSLAGLANGLRRKRWVSIVRAALVGSLCTLLFMALFVSLPVSAMTADEWIDFSQDDQVAIGWFGLVLAGLFLLAILGMGIAVGGRGRACPPKIPIVIY